MRTYVFIASFEKRGKRGIFSPTANINIWPLRDGCVQGGGNTLQTDIYSVTRKTLNDSVQFRLYRAVDSAEIISLLMLRYHFFPFDPDSNA